MCGSFVSSRVGVIRVFRFVKGSGSGQCLLEMRALHKDRINNKISFLTNGSTLCLHGLLSNDRPRRFFPYILKCSGGRLGKYVLTSDIAPFSAGNLGLATKDSRKESLKGVAALVPHGGNTVCIHITGSNRRAVYFNEISMEFRLSSLSLSHSPPHIIYDLLKRYQICLA
jgi:hypothetical protein